MSKASWRLLQVAVVAVVVVFVTRRVARQWSELASLRATIHVDWALMASSAGVVLLSYAVLIWTWQRTVRAWGEQLGFGDAARIWFISNLGRYIPGKIWQIGAMGMLAQRAGVSPIAAVGSSLVVSIVNVLAGIAVAVLCGVGDFGQPAWAIPAAIALALGVVAAPWLLPYVGRAASWALRRDISLPRLPHAAVWSAAAGCAVAWLLYGVAFRLLHVALLGETTGNFLRSTSAFTASYLAGFLFLPAPGGIGIREAALERLLSQFGIASGAGAWLVVIGSRLWLTVLEVLPGMAFLLLQKKAAAKPSLPTA